MCGIAGIAFAASSQPIDAMLDAVNRRGPDSKGQWHDQNTGITLGHTRLSIQDLTVAGHQPMLSHCGRYVLTYNGEIYNFQDLRQQLVQVGAIFTGHSDTEVLLNAISLWGIDKALSESIGMFAFALWDKESSTLTLARDRFGEKPLYYGRTAQGFLFASNLNALRAYPGFSADINQAVIPGFIQRGYIEAPHSIYKGIHKLMPGSYMTVSDAAEKIITYWSATEAALNGVANPFIGSFNDAVDELEKRVLASVKHQMIADVPYGTFLSGGVDSSLTTAVMQSLSLNPIKTFSIGFHQDKFNEAPFAKAVAEHIGTDHTELYCAEQDCLNWVEKLPDMYGEPFGDSSAIPTSLVSQLAREQVTVSLSGDGGDELFGGYPSYYRARLLWKTFGRIPGFIRISMGVLGEHIFNPLSKITSDYIVKLCWLLARSKNYYQFVDSFQSSFLSVKRRGLLSNAAKPLMMGEQECLLDVESYMMLRDACYYLPNDILTKVDGAAMWHGLETRVPLLDHRIYEFAWQLPHQYKIHQGVNKRVLRELLYRYVPRELIERPKQGFSIPMANWIKGPLQPVYHSLFTAERFDRYGIDAGVAKALYREHLSGQYDWKNALWYLLMLAMWD